jgi:hypothetical protein
VAAIAANSATTRILVPLAESFDRVRMSSPSAVARLVPEDG